MISASTSVIPSPPITLVTRCWLRFGMPDQSVQLRLSIVSCVYCPVHVVVCESTLEYAYNCEFLCHTKSKELAIPCDVVPKPACLSEMSTSNECFVP